MGVILFVNTLWQAVRKPSLFGLRLICTAQRLHFSLTVVIFRIITTTSLTNGREAAEYKRKLAFKLGGVR